MCVRILPNHLQFSHECFCQICNPLACGNAPSIKYLIWNKHFLYVIQSGSVHSAPSTVFKCWGSYLSVCILHQQLHNFKEKCRENAKSVRVLAIRGASFCCNRLDPFKLVDHKYRRATVCNIGLSCVMCSCHFEETSLSSDDFAWVSHASEISSVSCLVSFHFVCLNFCSALSYTFKCWEERHWIAEGKADKDILAALATASLILFIMFLSARTHTCAWWHKPIVSWDIHVYMLITVVNFVWSVWIILFTWMPHCKQFVYAIESCIIFTSVLWHGYSAY